MNTVENISKKDHYRTSTLRAFQKAERSFTARRKSTRSGRRALGGLFAIVRQITRGRVPSFFKRVFFRSATGIFRFAYHRRRSIRNLTPPNMSEYLFDNLTTSNALGERILSFTVSMVRYDIPLISAAWIYLLRYFLCASIGVHLAASQDARTLFTVRILNILFRNDVINRRSPVCQVYFETLYRLNLFEKILREVPEYEPNKDFYFNRTIGTAYLFQQKTGTARKFLVRAAKINPKDDFTYRLIARAHVLEGKYNAAKRFFRKSVKIYPASVMAHQNYSGRYDIPNYQPQEWELKKAGTLLIYDNLGQMAEDYFLRGRYDDSFDCYKKLLEYQKTLSKNFKLPNRLINTLEAQYPNFDRSKPVRLLPYEWIIQFGHIGLLDSHMKMVKLGMKPSDVNYVILAPESKVANLHYLAFWEEYYCIVRKDKLIDELFPYQRYIGEQFMAYLNDVGKVEHWTKAAARAHIDWAHQKRQPLLSLKKSQIEEGEKILQKIGVPPGSWFVGLHVREGGFYADAAGTGNEHRNSNIQDYLGAIEAITSRGGWVIRLGDSSMTPLPKMERVVDYALLDEKSAEMDLYLLSQARFVVGTTSGLTTCALSYGASMVLVNCISSDWQLWSSETDFIVKPLYDENSKRVLTLKETYRQPLQTYIINNSLLKREGYTPQKNTADEITQAVSYKLDIVLENSKRPPETGEVMKAYRQSLSENPYIFGAAKPVVPFLVARPELIASLNKN